MITQNIRAAYRAGWAALWLNKKVLLIIYGMNLMLAFVAMGPLSNLLRSVFGNNLLGSVIEKEFDYTIATEVLRHSDVGMGLAVNVLGSFVILFFPWSVFYQGGCLALARQYPHKLSLTEFWRGGAYYFLRFLRLATYTLLIMGALSYLGYIILKSDGFNPLAWESEAKIIITFKILVGLLMIAFFVIASFRDVAKVFIANNDSEFLFKNNIYAFSALFQNRILLLALLNIVVLIGASLIYALLRKLIGGYLIPAILVGQIFLIFRMMYSFVRLASFHGFFNNRTA